MKTKKYLLAFTGIIFFISGLTGLKAQTVTDIDGNVYNTVTIGTQTWMAENLKTTRYNDGTPIPLISDSIALVGYQKVQFWKLLNTGAYCWYNHKAEYKNIYGALYNSYAVNTNRLCPSGWHVPTFGDWRTLTSYLVDSIAGGKLKENGIEHWNIPNIGATNETGFTALPGGGRSEDGYFFDLGYRGIFWSSACVRSRLSGLCTNCRQARTTSYISSIVEGTPGLKSGFSVRCVCDHIILSIENVNSEDVVIYPNPADDRLYLKNSNYQNVIIMIYDLQGKKVLDRKIDSEVVDISNLKKGIYVVKLLCPETIVITKFIKE